MVGGRPGGVLLVAVLIWVSGALNTCGGVFVLVGVTRSEDASLAAGLLIIVGLVDILVSVGIFDGMDSARIVITFVFIVNIVPAGLLISPRWESVAAPAAAVLSLLSLILLYTPRSNEFFRK